jgi:hypothetical protein
MSKMCPCGSLNTGAMIINRQLYYHCYHCKRDFVSAVINDNESEIKILNSSNEKNMNHNEVKILINREDFTNMQRDLILQTDIVKLLQLKNNLKVCRMEDSNGELELLIKYLDIEIENYVKVHGYQFLEKNKY